MNKFLSATAISFALALGAPANAQIFDSETMVSLSQQVETLRAKLGSTTEIVEENRARVEEQEFLIENAPEVTKQMIEDLQTLVNAFDTESDYYASIQRAKQDIGVRIDRYRASESKVQQAAAEKLRERLDEFEVIDSRRDDLVGRALAAKRGLDIQREDLEAMIIVEAYGELSAIFSSMLDEVEGAVVAAEKMNADLIAVSGIESE